MPTIKSMPRFLPSAQWHWWQDLFHNGSKDWWKLGLNSIKMNSRMIGDS